MSATTEDGDRTLAPAELSPRAASESAPQGPGDMPSRIGRYVVLEELGAGGMGVVYAAYDPELDRKVAIKLMYAESDRKKALRSQSMLMREAQALARLSHPNIVAIHDVGVYAGQVFVAMEFVAGCTVRRWRAAAPREWQEVVAVFVQAGRGLMAAHAAALVHRDVKPDNLLVGDDGRVRVADFGVARHNAPDEAEVTSPSGSRALVTVAGGGETIGTPAYMAPEQHSNEGVGPHSDQFSFCVALYEALYGVRPFAGETSAALAAAIRGGTPRRPSMMTKLPPWLDKALLRGLAAQPEARFPSMQALLAELTQDRDARRARWRWRVIYGLLLVAGAVGLYQGGRALQASRARVQLEATAAERLEVVGADIDRLLARERRADAEEALRAFLAEPEHRETRAVIDAWLLWADRMDRAGDGAAALAAVVEAYTELPADDDREPAIHLRMARLFRAGWRFHELATLAAQARRRAAAVIEDPAWAELRADTALARRDIAGFLAEVDAGRVDPSREAAAPVVRALAEARFSTAAEEAVIPLPIDLEGDGRDELALIAVDGGSELRRMDGALTLIGRDWPALPIDRGWVNREALNRGPGQAGLLIGHTFTAQAGETTLYLLGSQPREVMRWEEDRPRSASMADLDGDGLRELYVGTGPYSRNLYRIAPDADGVWRRELADAASEGLGSDVNALVGGDFDGDGREELAVALGPWRAYDVRILEAGADGELAIGARWRIGHVHTMASLRAADGATLLAIAKDNDAASKQAFPASKPHGEPPGVYIVRREGSQLRPVHFSPAPVSEGAEPGQVTWLARGDLDGDGRDDLIGKYIARSRGEFVETLIWRQLADGSFVRVALGHIDPAVVGQFDDDVADELLVRTRGSDGASRFAVLGAGGDGLPAIEPTRVPAATPVLADPELAHAWRRAEELAGFGLFAAAATALERRISLAQTVADRRAVQLRAAELHDADGDLAAAAAGQELLAQDGDLQAGFAALAGYERALRLGDALRVARGLLARTDLDGVQRARASEARDRLAAVVEWGDAIDLRFDRPLAPQWRIHEPLALRVDPVRGELIVDATAEMTELASLPLVVAGGPLALEVELEVERAEWSSILQVALVDPAGAERLRVGISAGGGGGYLLRNSRVDALENESPIPLGEFQSVPGERSRHHLRAQLLPGQGVLHMEELGDHPGQRSLPLRAPLVAGDYRLVVRAAGVPHYGAHQARARIRRIAVTGASLGVATEPETARDRGALALVSGRWRGALAEAGSDALWRAVAAAELGRVIEAVALLQGLDPREPSLRMQLRQLLRARPGLAWPLLRAGFADELGGLLAEALLEPTRMHLDEELQRAWLTVGGDLEALPQADAAQRTGKATLLRARGQVWQSIGALEAAAEDLDAAVVLLEQAASEAGDIAEIELSRAQVAAARGQSALAIAAATRALAGAREPAWMAERMRMDVRLQALAGDPGFTRLLAAYP